MESVYPQGLAWRRALFDPGLDASAWRIHRRVGMSGGLLVHAPGRELGHRLSTTQVGEVQAGRTPYLHEAGDQIPTLPGASHLLRKPGRRHVLVAVATSGTRESAGASPRSLGVGSEVPVVIRDEVPFAKPDPGLFLAAAESLGASIGGCIVLGGSIWDILAARRAGSLGLGRLSGGYSRQELEVAGAFSTGRDPAAMEDRLEELGIRR